MLSVQMEQRCVMDPAIPGPSRPKRSCIQRDVKRPLTEDELRKHAESFLDSSDDEPFVESEDSWAEAENLEDSDRAEDEIINNDPEDGSSDDGNSNDAQTTFVWNDTPALENIIFSGNPGLRVPHPGNNAYDFFSLLVTDELLIHIVEQTNVGENRMVYRYIRKTSRGESWSEDDMARAIESIKNKEISIRQASIQFNIKYSTLQKHQEEEEFYEHIKELDGRFYGLTRKDLCQLAYQFAEKNRINHPFKNDMAGSQWYTNFMKRHPRLSLRQPEPTSIARARGFNKPQVQIFFDNLKSVIEKHNIVIDNIYNVDETGIHTSAKKPPKVISLVGKKQVGSISSAERGTLITSLFCCSATGKFIPPALVFPRKKRNPRYLKGTPPGTIDLVTDNGWINTDTFLEWMKFFVSSVRPSATHKCLLIMDNHSSHRSIQVLDFASENNIILLTIPPHTTHKLQPLDVAVYGPFGKYFQNSIDKWQKTHASQHVTFFDIGEIFCEAYLKAAIPNNAIKGFKKTGISDCNIDVFTDVDFLPSDVTDCDKENSALNETQESTVHDTHSQVNGNDNFNNNSIGHIQDNIQIGENNKPSYSTSGLDHSKTLKPEAGLINNNNYNKKIRIIDIHVIPKCTKRSSGAGTKRKAQKSEILTSTPIKEEIRTKTKAKTESVKRKIGEPSNGPKLKIPKPPVEMFNPDENNVPCLFCSDTFGNSVPEKSRITEWKDVTLKELKVFLGIWFHMGNIRINRLQDYWKKDELFAIPGLQKHMSRNRFMLIMRCLHFSKNPTKEDDPGYGDRLHRIRFLQDYFNRRMAEVYYPGKQLSLDESMVLLRGRLGFRQFIKGKKHKFGMKLYILAEPNGLTLRCFVYSGAQGELGGTGHAEKVVMSLMKGLENKGHALYMDNFYNSVTLCQQLLQNKTYVTGTLRKGRKGTPKVVADCKIGKGEIITKYSNGVAVSKWRDKRDVLFLSTEFEEEMIEVRRKRDDVVKKPKAIVMYNEHMSGIDRQDQMLAYYPSERKTLRWYKKLGINFLSMLFLNSYFLFKAAMPNANISFYDYRITVIKRLLEEKDLPPVQRPAIAQHFPVKLDRTHRKRCRHYYLEVLAQLRERIRKKRPELWQNKLWVIYQDNAPAHSASSVKTFLAQYNIPVLDRLPYSPVHAPRDFHPFPKVKPALKGTSSLCYYPLSLRLASPIDRHRAMLRFYAGAQRFVPGRKFSRGLPMSTRC
ncbi:hypothetical protein NQ318_022534 [Aromia moschata]|uniref:Transposase n=1 Tax=Aromia moschata TaxID=1265417 RepID=A0AAV8XKH0_9CUCU|nr:hypothetical protein NQ318_022534 [Aromia moschata]